MVDYRAIDDVTGRLAVSQDRLELVDDDTSARLYVKQKYERKPLSGDETHLILSLNTEHGTAEIALDAAQMDALADQIHDIQAAYSND